MTAQQHERMVIDGEELSMAFCPPLPERHPRITDRRRDPSGSGTGEVDGTIHWSSDCWRGYQGTWEVRDGWLFLKHLEGRFKLTPGDPLRADWFTGVLRIPRGKILQYVHMGFGSVFEEELHISVETGRITGRSIVDNRGKDFDKVKLAFDSLPGRENRFEGDGLPPRARPTLGGIMSRWFGPPER